MASTAASHREQRRHRERHRRPGADTLTGNDTDNILTGNAGNDSLMRPRHGCARGGLGTDMFGGADGDIYYWDDLKAISSSEPVDPGEASVKSFVSFAGAQAAEFEDLDADWSGAVLNGTGNGQGQSSGRKFSAARHSRRRHRDDTMRGGAGNDHSIRGCGRRCRRGRRDRRRRCGRASRVRRSLYARCRCREPVLVGAGDRGLRQRARQCHHRHHRRQQPRRD